MPTAVNMPRILRVLFRAVIHKREGRLIFAVVIIRYLGIAACGGNIVCLITMNCQILVLPGITSNACPNPEKSDMTDCKKRIHLPHLSVGTAESMQDLALWLDLQKFLATVFLDDVTIFQSVSVSYPNSYRIL